MSCSGVCGPSTFSWIFTSPCPCPCTASLCAFAISTTISSAVTKTKPQKPSDDETKSHLCMKMCREDVGRKLSLAGCVDSLQPASFSCLGLLIHCRKKMQNNFAWKKKETKRKPCTHPLLESGKIMLNITLHQRKSTYQLWSLSATRVSFDATTISTKNVQTYLCDSCICECWWT